MPISQLKKYDNDFSGLIGDYLKLNRIKTMKDFMELTEERLLSMPARGKQLVYRNTLKAMIKSKERILSEIKCDCNFDV